MQQISAPKRRRSSVMGYEQSLMFGQYREQMANFALLQAQKAKELEESRQKEVVDKEGNTFNDKVQYKLRRIIEIGGDWIILAILGIIIALLSFIMDELIKSLFHARNWLVKEITDVFVYNYLIWILFMVTLVLVSATIVRLVAPQAAGSGVAEMKVVLRGVVLKVRTLITKIIGLPFALGSGIPVGKEGPFVHISAMVANQLMKLFGSISSQLEYESRFLEVIAVACAVGVSATFASPVGGVLYSIEIVSVFFAVRSYWQGFFAATFGALLWRLLTVWFQYEENITHIFKTDFRKDHPYETFELIPFSILGILCGFGGHAFVVIQRHIVLFNRKHAINSILQKYPLIYPIIASFIIAVISFPPAFGQFYGSWMSSEQAMHELFSNYTWGLIENEINHDEIIDNWRTPYTSIYTNTFLFFLMNLLMVPLASTIPVPCGLIVPSFKIGAGLGRFFGESMAYLFPKGINPFYDRTDYPLIPGAYAVAGAAAFAGASTGALSSAVIAFEMTGQLTHLLPVIVAVIIANMVMQHLGPSIYDSLIKLKNLPYLPPIMQSSNAAHRIFVQDYMQRDLLYVWEGCTYRYLRHLLNSKKHLNIYPYVKSPDTMILLGTVQRIELQNLLDQHLSKDRLMKEMKSKPPPSSPPSASCPIHGQQRFQVTTIPEEEVLITSVGKHAWEEEQLNAIIDFTLCPIDPAPFQLVEGTSLMKAHNLFSLLGVQTAYVTSLGRIIGVVALKEIRLAIEQMNSGALPRKKSSAVPESQPLKEP